MADNRVSAEEIRRWYERHGPALVAHACGYGLDFASGEDVVHGVFHRLLRQPVSVPENPAGYLYRAVRNAALNARRDGARQMPLEETCFVHSSGGREAGLALQKALATLPEEQREAVIMRIWGGLTLEEIAGISGAPLNTIASRYRYALEKLREALQPRCG